ncbi:hypothetical protein [Flavobacterium sp. 14A]|uniref:hypothetical protein n=1 Tax=Flavobacterium sp. 14A TaxID=2735896 RepID=UPI00156E139A|nr:hypothetical protein [Flavobacterium sp. 14A]NRT13654.1 3-methyladenine DNA glycosylase Tag [Flavobacterium sp. 14A]
MEEKEILYRKIDLLIETIDNYKNEPSFVIEKDRRQNKIVSDFKNDNEILKTFAYLIAYSQNANSELVEQILKSGNYDKAFENFEIEKVIKLNPCDIADDFWESIKGIRQQGKLFHIVTLARKIKKIGSFHKLLNEINIPKEIKTETDIENFWSGFNKLQKTLIEIKIPFFQSTTSLLHFLLESGYDCVKPDLVVMKVAAKLQFVDEKTGDKNFRKAVRVIQEYSLNRNIRPTIVDYYFLIDEGQLGAKKYVKEEFYKRNK